MTMRDMDKQSVETKCAMMNNCHPGRRRRSGIHGASFELALELKRNTMGSGFDLAIAPE